MQDGRERTIQGSGAWYVVALQVLNILKNCYIGGNVTAAVELELVSKSGPGPGLRESTPDVNFYEHDTNAQSSTSLVERESFTAMLNSQEDDICSNEITGGSFEFVFFGPCTHNCIRQLENSLSQLVCPQTCQLITIMAII